MALPILDTATYELTLPSSDVQVKYRPFLVKEEKILLQAMESQEQKQIVQALKDIVNVCTHGQLNVDELPTFDLEYVFLQIRGKSVGEKMKINILCPDDKKTYVPTEIMLDDIRMKTDTITDGDIKLIDGVGITMRYPRIKDMMEMNEEDGAVKISMDIIEKTVKNIYDKEEVYEEFSKKELDDFIEQLNTEQFEKIQEFYDTAPKLSHTVMVTNPNTGIESEVVVEGLQSFLE